MRRIQLSAIVLTVAALALPAGTGTAQEAGPIRILFFGNSHTQVHDVPALVEGLIEGATGREVEVATAPGILFLDERLADPASLALLDQQQWTAVVLQAQRYSMSGRQKYSTAEAEQLAAMVRDRGAVPVLFPEWARRGVDETDRIHGLHVSIAEASPACVPPIPEAFDRALAAHRDLVLHADDGNHSSPTGAVLAAVVLAHAVSGVTPELQPVRAFGVTDGEARALTAAAGWAVSTTPPWRWCPAGMDRADS